MADEANKAASSDFVRALRSAAFTGLIAFGLFLPLIAFKAVHDIRNELVLETRWELFAIFVAIAFGARLIWELLPHEPIKVTWRAYMRSPRLLAITAAASFGIAVATQLIRRSVLGAEHDPYLILLLIFAVLIAIAAAIGCAAAWVKTNFPDTTDEGRQRRRQIGIALRTGALGFLVVYPMMMLLLAGPQGAIKWVDNFGIQILIYVMLAWGLNIVVGLAGLLDLGYVAFYAVGAYSFALLAQNGLPFVTFASDYPFLAIDFVKLGPWAFWLLLPIAGILAAFWGVLLGFPVLRLRGDYLAIVTLAFGEIIRLVLINWVDADQWLRRHLRHPAADLLRHPVQCQ